MNRLKLISLSVIVALFMGGFMTVSTSPVSAAEKKQTQAQANACYKKYNKVSYGQLADGEGKTTFYLNCTNVLTGNCDARGGGPMACTTKPGSNYNPLSAEEVKNCFDDWNGVTLDSDDIFNDNFNRCADPAYGNCSYTSDNKSTCTHTAGSNRGEEYIDLDQDCDSDYKVDKPSAACEKKKAAAAAAFAAKQKAANGGADLADPAFSGQAGCNKDGCDLIAKYVNPLIVVLTTIVGIAIAIGIIFGAIQIISSAGDPAKAASGRNHIRNAILAAVAYGLLFALLNWLLPGGISS